MIGTAPCPSDQDPEARFELTEYYKDVAILDRTRLKPVAARLGRRKMTNSLPPESLCDPIQLTEVSA